MVILAEWAVPLFRLAILAMTPLHLLRTAPIRVLVGSLVAAYLVLLYLAWHRRGPYGRGPAGIVFDVALVVVVMVLFAALLPARTYAQPMPAAPLPLANFLAPCAAVLGLWPAPGPHRHARALYVLRDVLVVGSLVPFFAVLCLVNGYRLDELSWGDLAMQALPSWLALFVGYALARIAVDFAASQADLIRAQAEERLALVEQEQHRHFDWLHSRVLPVLSTIGLHLESGRISAEEAAAAARHVEFTIREHRHRGLLNDQQVRLADIVSFYMRFSRGNPDRAEDLSARTGLGGVTLDAVTAGLVDRTMGGLVSNAAKHAGPGRWTCHVSRTPGTIVIQVEDDGPGFSESQMTQPGTSLNDLRCALVEAGGSLTRVAPDTGPGTVMIAYIPEDHHGSPSPG